MGITNGCQLLNMNIMESNLHLDKPKNDYSRCLFVLIKNHDRYISMKDVLQEYPLFYKWQARLYDIKRMTSISIDYKKITYNSESLNKQGYYFQYKSTNTKDELVTIYNSINK